MANDGAWKAPGSGTPLAADDVAAPSASDIAGEITRRLVVPRGPLRTATLLLGGTLGGIISGALNSAIRQPILAAPGIITTLDIIFSLVTTGAAAGFLQLIDNDSNSPMLRTVPVSVGAAGSYSFIYSSGAGDLPFLGGIVAVWTPITGAFGASLICVNIDFRSIPIGQRD